ARLNALLTSATPNRVALTVLLGTLAVFETPMRLSGQALGSGTVQLTDTNPTGPLNIIHTIGISPDGSIVVFYTGGGLNSGIDSLYEVPSDGSAPPRLITPPGFNLGSASFGGTKVAFVAQSPPVGCSNLACP